MKTSESVKAVSVAMTVIVLFVVLYGGIVHAAFKSNEYVSENIIFEESLLTMDANTYTEPSDLRLVSVNNYSKVNIEVAEAVYEEPVVYDGLTMSELSAKLNRTLHSTMSGKGELIASYSLSLGVDPYLAVAVIMHESGCEWECSGLLKQCNNVGGMKGAGGCGGGEYAKFPTLDDGIRSYIYNLYKNYFSLGLTTPEAIGPKYAASKTWATQVNAYIAKIKRR